MTSLPNITYRRGRNLKEFLVHSHFETSKSATWLKSNSTGSYPCGSCTFCKYMDKKKSFVNPRDNRSFEIQQFINCRTTKVIYAAQCSCPKLYVGKTIQQLRRRISQHISTINTGADTPLSRHVRYFHNGEVDSLKFWGICKLQTGPRKGNIDKKLLQEEARWIFRLNSLSPGGLNEGFTFYSFSLNIYES